MEQLVENPTDVKSRYDSAVSSRDVSQLKQIAKDNLGTPASEIALGSAQVIEKNLNKFGQIIDPIEKKGGPGSPEGRQEIVKQFETTADNPKWGTALLKYVLGDKAGAVKQVTGGDITKKITYDNKGNQIEETVNELGEALSYYDRKEKRNISKEEYAARVGGISSWNNTLYGKAQSFLSEKSTEQMLKEDKATNYWTSLTQSHAPGWQEIYNTLKSYKGDIPADLYNKIVSTTASSLSQASASSRGSSVLDQLQKTVSRGENARVSDELAASLGLPRGKEYIVKGNRIVSTDNKFSQEIGALSQTQSSANISNEAQKNASSTRDSILEAERLKILTPEQAQRFLRVIEISQKMGKETMDAVAEYGKPGFISLPTAASIENKQAQILAQALQGMHNVEQMRVYQQYRNEAKKGYEDTKTVPMPGAIDAGYSMSPIYQDLRKFYAQKIEEVMSGNYERPEQKEKPRSAPRRSSGEAIAPKATALPKGVPEGSTATNLRTPDGKKLWKDRQGRLHTED